MPTLKFNITNQLSHLSLNVTTLSSSLKEQTALKRLLVINIKNSKLYGSSRVSRTCGLLKESNIQHHQGLLKFPEYNPVIYLFKVKNGNTGKIPEIGSVIN